MGSADWNETDGLGDFLDEGWEKVWQGDIAGAHQDAERTLALDPASPEAHNLMGYVLAAEGAMERAAAHYDKALELDPGFGEALLNHADLQLAVGESARGLALLDELLAISEASEERVEATLMRIEALNRLDRREEAAEACEGLLTAEPESAELELAIGRVLFEAGSIELAEARLRRAISRGVTSGDAEYFLGVIADTGGDAEAATLHFIRARELDSDGPVPAWTHPRWAFERMVQEAIRALPAPWATRLEGTLVVCADLPGIELVADGLDPRTPVFADAVSGEGEQLEVGRLFVYQRPVELIASAPEHVAEELEQALLRELTAVAQPPPAPS
ncbi:MAG: tetratricopeptide repeat protein [Deltaproteobacteria bacterium]|nr:tetratricopeptide repeat protein [Deltaproteobacteria bacterium]